MKLPPLVIVLALVIAVAIGSILGYSVRGMGAEGFSSNRYKCKEFIDMSKYMLKTECPPMPDMSKYVLRSEVPKCPPCICTGSKPANVGKCPPCPRPRCPKERGCHCKPCAPCPKVQPMRCPEPEVVIKEVYRNVENTTGPRPALSPIYGIYGNYK